MKRLALLVLAIAITGCARPGEMFWNTSQNIKQQERKIARNWDWEGKQLVDDVEHALLLRPIGHLTLWHLR